MFTKFRARFSSAHVMAGLALFIVLGGTAFAVKSNSVGSKQIKKNAVKSSKIANNAVTSSKIAANAVTGDKVDESSLGKVPSATAADTATTATTATDATNAQNAVNAQNAANAQNATNATNATNAANSTTLAGREFQQVRGLADGDSDGVTNGLPNATFETVLTEDIGIPTGGADVIVNSSVELENNSGAQQGGQCRLSDESGTISQTYNVTIPPGFTVNVSLTAFNNYPTGTAALDPEDITVSCAGSGAANDVRFLSGDIAVQRIPDGV